MKCAFVLMILALPVTLLGADSTVTAKLDPGLPYQAMRSNPVTYEVDFSVVVTPPYKAKVMRVWLPLPQSDAAQQVDEGILSTFPMSVQPTVDTEKVFGNKFAYFEFIEPQGAQIIRHTFTVKVWELRWDLDPGRVAAVSEWPVEFDSYRKGESQAVVVDDRVKQLFGQIVPRCSNPLRDMASVINWVHQNFEYDHADASLRASSLHALEKRHGHCSDYHGFCASMGRVMGYPTRVTYGINAFPKNSPSHCKLEVFLPPHGWVSFDVSETQNLLAAIKKDAQLDGPRKERLIQATKDRMLRGFRDNTWFLQTKGTDYDLVPPASKRVPVVRTAYVESDGAALPEPDPANKNQRGFAWMTVHQFTPDRTVSYPFKDFKGLEKDLQAKHP
jgi:transglutaminase-like putative cysteine protease